MADTPKPNPPAESDMHWGISYLREDIQDLRFGVRALHDHVDRLAERMERLAEASTARIETVNENLTKRIDSRFALLLTAMIALTCMGIGANFAVLQMYLPSQ